MGVRTRRLRTLASLVRLPTSRLSGGGGRGLDTPVEVRWAELIGGALPGKRPQGLYLIFLEPHSLFGMRTHSHKHIWLLRLGVVIPCAHEQRQFFCAQVV